MPLDTILIDQLELFTVIGVHAWEQHMPRRIVIDLELDADFSEAAASDRLRDAIDYKAVCDEIETLIQTQRFQLIEALAEAIARRLFTKFPIAALRLRIGKPGAIPSARDVAVKIARQRADYAVCGR